MIRRPRRSPPFPYPPLFRSLAVRRARAPLAVAGAALTADRHRDLGAGVGELGKPALETFTMRVARRILAHRFVGRTRNFEMPVGGHTSRVTPARIALSTRRQGRLRGARIQPTPADNDC